MMSQFPLVPCVGCQRHVRVGEAQCPFCGEKGPRVARPLRVPKGRLSSLLVMTFQAAAVTAVAGCGAEVSEPGPPTSTGGASGHAGESGSGGSVSAGGGGSDDTSTGGRPGMGGEGGAFEFGTGGDSSQGRGGGPVPIYRATPRG
jgi:hypothetical protein